MTDFSFLVKTDHVLCPRCGQGTMGPYHNPVNNVYFDGHYCEECGINWRWVERSNGNSGFVEGL